MAAFHKAMARVLEVRKARGYFQKPGPTAQSSPERQARLKEMMKHAPCRACGQAIGAGTRSVPRTVRLPSRAPGSLRIPCRVRCLSRRRAAPTL